MAKNKLQKFADMKAWTHVYEFAQSDYATTEHPLKGHWAERAFSNDHPLVLELGCGKGEYTVGLAGLYPDKNFIGIDIKGARMWTGARIAREQQLDNVAFLRTHIEFLPQFFAPGEVAEIWLTFPDPQMKKTRKRLTSTRFMQDYARMLRPDACIHLKTDSQFMFRYTLAMIEANALPLQFQTFNLYQEGVLQQAGVPNIQTFYEKQWLDRGIDIKYLRFALNPDQSWQEPQVDIEPDEYRSFGRNARVQ